MSSPSSTGSCTGRACRALQGYTGNPANPSPPANLVQESRTYDPAGRLASVTNVKGTQTNYTYYGDNRLASSYVVCPACSGGKQSVTANGKAVPISSLKPGEKVVATNTKTGKTQAGTIAAVLVHHDTNRYDLTVRAHGRTAVIHTTSNHPFWDATTHRWVKAGALRYGTHLRTAAGGTATVLGGHAPRHRSGWMWDLTIPGNHDFYVIAADTDVLVHNCGEELTSDELRAQARDKWEAVTGHPAIWDKMVIHHEVPLEWRHVYSGDINGLDNLRGMLAEDHYGITEAWRVWKVGLQGRTPSEAELLQQRNSLRNIYGPLVVSH